MSFIPQFVLQSEAVLEQCTYGICIADTRGTMIKPLRELVDSFEKTLLENALHCFERQEDAASALKISMSTMTRKIRKHRISKAGH